MATEFDLAEELRTYNLTSEEYDTIKLNESKLTDKKTVKEFIDTMRKENARKTAEKDPKDIAWDELQVAWETAKDNKELADVKESLQKKSEEMMKIVDVENPDMSTAAELDEWLKINNSLDNKDNKDRNQKIGASLSSYFEQYDKRYEGLSDLTPDRAKQIQANANDIRTRLADFDPFAVKEDGTVVDPRFEPLKKFYDSLNLVDENGKQIAPEEKAKLIEEAKKLAKEETITRLSLVPDYAQADEATKNKMILAGMHRTLEEGTASVLKGYISSQNIKTDEEAQEQAKQLLQLASEGKPLPPMEYKVVGGALAGRWQETVNLNKRISQKTGKRSLWGKVKAGWKNFQKNHPYIAGAAKVMGNIGLTVGVNMVLGGTGLAALGVYRTYQAIKKANEQRKQEGYDGSLLKYIGTHPRHIVSIASNVASIGLAGWSAMQGLDANGLVGQAFNHGVGNAFDNVKAMGEGLWNTVTHPFSHAADAATAAPSGESTGFFADAGKKISNMFDSSNALRFSRTIRTIGVSTANLGLDIADVFKPENKGKRWKKLFGAFAKATATGAAVWATTPTEMAGAGMSGGAASASAAAGATAASFDINKSLAENLEANHFEPGSHFEPTPIPGIEESEIKVPYAPGMQPEANDYVESQENLTHWENRIDKFLEKTGQADEIKNHVYDMIDKGEIKLPEGIETKEEYLYKMVMKMEQRPLDITKDLDVKLSTLTQENMMAKMSAEDFNKISSDLNDYSDKGVYHGPNTDGNINTHPSEEAVVNNSGGEENNINNDNQDLASSVSDNTQTSERTTDEEFREKFGAYMREEDIQDNLNVYHDMLANGNEEGAAEMLKKLEQDVLPHGDSSTINEELVNNASQQQELNEYGEYPKAPEEKTYDWESSVKDLATGNAATGAEFESTPIPGMEEQEIVPPYAEGFHPQQTDEITEQPAAPASEQIDETTGQPAAPASEQIDGTEGQAKPSELEQKQEDQDKPAGTENKGDETAKTASEKIDEVESSILKANSTIDLSNTENLREGQVIIEKDKLGNFQFVGKDESGNAFSITVPQNVPGVHYVGTPHAIVDVPQDSPLYDQFHPNKEGLSGSERLFKDMDGHTAQDDYAKKIMEKIHHKEFQFVDKSGNAIDQAKDQQEAAAPTTEAQKIINETKERLSGKGFGENQDATRTETLGQAQKFNPNLRPGNEGIS